MTLTETWTANRTDPTTGEPVYTHIVPPGLDASGQMVDGAVLVMTARVEGTPVTALCGWTWVPTRDPKQYPLCGRCEEIHAALIGGDPSDIPAS